MDLILPPQKINTKFCLFWTHSINFHAFFFKSSRYIQHACFKKHSNNHSFTFLIYLWLYYCHIYFSINNTFTTVIIAGSLEAAYSLNWGAQEIWGKGWGGDLGTFMISRPYLTKTVIRWKFSIWNGVMGK